MKNYENTLFSISSVFLLLSGLAQILMDLIITYYKIVVGDYKPMQLFLAAALLILSGLLSIIVAIVSLANRRKRIRTGMLAFFGRLVVILTLAGCVFLGLKSIYAWQVNTVAFIGIFFPIIYVIGAVRKGFKY